MILEKCADCKVAEGIVPYMKEDKRGELTEVKLCQGCDEKRRMG